MKLLLILAAIVALVFLAGCVVAQRFIVKDVLGNKTVVAILGQDLKVVDLQTVTETLARLNDPMLVEGLSFHILPDDSHLEKTWTGKIAGAHCCGCDHKRVCLGPGNVNFRLICHEMAHVYHHYLNSKGEQFSLEWLAIAGDVYQRDESLPNKDGILTIYSRGSFLEDVAEWGSECYSYLRLGNNYVITGNPHVKIDRRYKKKLALLYKYQFFSKEDYQKLKPLFE